MRQPRADRVRPGKAAILRAAVQVMGEDGYEGASTRDMAARAGVSVAALYYHFPTKLDLLREFLDEAYDVLLARLDRRVGAAGDEPGARLDAAVATLIWSSLHDEFAQLATNVAYREYTRLDTRERAGIDAKRRQIIERVEAVVVAGVERGVFATDEPFESARAVVTLCASLVEPFPTMGRTLPEVIGLYQRFARALARQEVW